MKQDVSKNHVDIIQFKTTVPSGVANGSKGPNTKQNHACGKQETEVSS